MVHALFFIRKLVVFLVLVFVKNVSRFNTKTLRYVTFLIFSDISSDNSSNIYSTKTCLNFIRALVSLVVLSYKSFSYNKNRLLKMDVVHSVT